MGNTNSSTRESRTTSSRSRSGTANDGSSNTGSNENSMYNVRSGRGSRQNLSFLHLGSSSRGDQQRTEEPRRETKQEREARKREKERVARENERERSMKEEGVDGGYLVTLGTYVGPEDFNKTVVRQLMIERRLAPFWKGLNDHSESWTENQLVAVARGLALPAPDDPPLPDLETTTGSDVDSLTIPIASRSQSYQSEHMSPPSSATFPRPGGSSLPSASASRGLFRDRAKTLASLGTSNKNNNASSTSIAPQEIRLPREPRVNGSPLEAVLYKDASECPICFMYYPPYLNKTRCCDQPICSECFVQIKRPDPHPPEHHDDDGNPTTDEEGLLVSEPAACPFCVTPEFGVSYQPPTFRRGLVYSGPVSSPAPTSAPSPDASSLSLAAPPGRRRTTSLSASAPTVITTDRVRPDWAKKLADARAHALRRSAAATALHNAAYMLGNQQPSDSRSFGGLGRRRRTLLADTSASASGSGTPRADNGQVGSLSELIAHIEGQGSSTEPRPSGRRSRAHDLEDLMMMEAIRLSLASEEDRKRKEEKEVRKEAKKREKEAAKEAKKAEKAAKKSGSLYNASMNGSTATWSDMTRSTSNIPRPQTAVSTASSPPPAPPSVIGKGKAPATTSYGFNPLSEPTSTLNTEVAEQTADSQRHLEESRANLPQATQPISFPEALQNRSHLRHISNASSAASSMLDSAPGSYQQRMLNHQISPNTSATVLDDGTGTPDTQSGTPGNDVNTEPMFNFKSLSEMIRNDDKDRDADHVEFFEQKPEEERKVSVASIASNSRVNGSDGSSGLSPLNEDERESTRHGDAVQVNDETMSQTQRNETKHAGDVNVLHTSGTSTN
ncbi:uncharacterized protein M437DRAFT_44944 [Aureobasidium melanogenum CBS 110374]|uniref:Protein sip5 n=1 Tax=Aureobasidium melanogenum (strain CBS 110374) TaxID=1043003 RepID=A0A074VU41_AURM1|nr:uncharacterized protein M437DRAFT_44944 [Aureobasidium melanogenum CBS 110374]KEQ64305.1 hypothetical protein M437DRAFT_44944 [Aureobasidium melanogenum CBS 110374]